MEYMANIQEILDYIQVSYSKYGGRQKRILERTGILESYFCLYSIDDQGNIQISTTVMAWAEQLLAKVLNRCVSLAINLGQAS